MAIQPIEVPKNSAETLRVERGAYAGVELIHVRAWTGRPGDPAARPTRKGLSCAPRYGARSCQQSRRFSRRKVSEDESSTR